MAEQQGRVASSALSMLDQVLSKNSAPRAAAAAFAARRPRVLVADDDEDYRGIVAFLLKNAGCEVTEAAEGRQAVTLAQKAPPDLVIMDLAMPDISGYEAIGELRSSLETLSVPVIVLSGATNRESIKGALDHVRAFHSKPVKNTDLLASVRAVLGDVVRPPAEEAVLLAPSEHEEALEVEGLADEEPVPEAAPLTEDADDSPIVAQVNRILAQAVQKGASDIHVEPFESELIVRFRVNGALVRACSLPVSAAVRLTARVKVMSNLSLTERRRPQDGRLRARIGGRKVELRVSTIPGVFGEKIVMRILGGAQANERLDLLGMTVRDLERVEQALSSPHGLILVTGPTGSGKSTTLYTFIRALAKPDVNVVTVEDPVEAEIPGVTQMAVRADLGVTFETALRAFLRQDPDIMLVGEIRDLDTAQIAVKASVTGHLVLSTLHTNSAAATALRLVHMGLPGYLVSSSVRLIVAQRLVRRLCAHCREQGPAPETELRLLHPAERAPLERVWSAPGCDACRQTGCAGRRALFEVMPVATPELKRLLLHGGSPEEVAARAEEEGMTTLRKGALALAAAGDISLAEALKVALGE